MVEHLEDLHPLLFASRKVFNPCPGINLKTIPRRQCRELVLHRLYLERKCGCIQANHHILGNRKRGNEHQFLVDHGDTVGQSIARRRQVHDFTIDSDFTPGLCVIARQNIGDHGFAGTIFTE